MKLRNKKNGEIKRVEFLAGYQNDDGTEIGFRVADTLDVYSYTSISELNAEWEDYEESKDNNYWYIDDFGRIQFSSELLDEVDGKPNNWMARKLFGNYFETEEEAELAVRKLKAWKRLKDKGFRFFGVRGLDYAIDFEVNPPYSHITFDEYTATEEQNEFYNDLMLLFGGEE